MKIINLILIALSISMGGNISKIVKKLERNHTVVVTHTDSNETYNFKELDWYDKDIPLTISLLEGQQTNKIIYLIAAMSDGLEFRTHETQSLSQFYREKGYLVVGITPRSENIPDTTTDFKFTKRWGIEKRTKGFFKVVKKVKKAVNLNYEILGFSYGAAIALDYAANHNNHKLDKVIVLDVDSYSDPQSIDNANTVYEASKQLINEGIYVDQITKELAYLAYLATLDPFYAELLIGALVYSGTLDGIHTPITGLPGDWSITSNAVADENGLIHTSIETINEAAQHIKSGIIPIALLRDFSSATANNEEGYTIDIEEIQTQVLWINTEFGYGDQNYWCELIENCETDIIPGYGHIDAILGINAKEDVWELF